MTCDVTVEEVVEALNEARRHICLLQRDERELNRRLGNLEVEVKALRKAVLSDDVGALRAQPPYSPRKAIPFDAYGDPFAFPIVQTEDDGA